MARRMGHHYERIILSEGGSRVKVPQLLDTAKGLLAKIHTQPTCVLPAALQDPYFDSIKGAFSLND